MLAFHVKFSSFFWALDIYISPVSLYVKKYINLLWIDAFPPSPHICGVHLNMLFEIQIINCHLLYLYKPLYLPIYNISFQRDIRHPLEITHPMLDKIQLHQ